MWDFKPPSSRFFTEDERKQLEALFSEILPTDRVNNIPGATEANAAEYIDRLLAMKDSTYYEIEGWRKLYREGLSALSKACNDMYARSISELSSAERANFLQRLSAGQLQGLPDGFEQKKFFQTMRAHCIEGCFADPRWGGNKEERMWQWFGYLQ